MEKKTPISFSNMGSVLLHRARVHGDREAFIYLRDGESQEASISYTDLARKAVALATHLRNINAKGVRVLLLFPSGLEYISAFFGCLLAGAVAVPAYPPRPRRSLDRILSIVTDSQASICLFQGSLGEAIFKNEAGSQIFNNLHLVAIEEASTENSSIDFEVNLEREDVAFLQYTSGSTGNPKGVALSHANLLHNQTLIHQCFGLEEDSRVVSWLPLYHDMGLIGNVIYPVFVGCTTILMSPLSFIQKPVRWLQAISKYRGTTSGGPNFSYELCVQKVTAEENGSLDLSSWMTAFNGAEPVCYRTLNRFTERFEKFGFRKAAFLPCYGLAEATLIVSGGSLVSVSDDSSLENESKIHTEPIEKHGRKVNQRSIVSSGKILQGQVLKIVDPDNFQVCPQGMIGEIWISSHSVSRGYWNKPEYSNATFNAYLSNRKEGPFLRTGDLGFVQGEYLFVTGRIKDVLIVRGLKFYPEDIEQTARNSHPLLYAERCVAFSTPINGEDKIVLMQELDKSIKSSQEAEIVSFIRKEIAREHEINLENIILVAKGTLPITSSGKIKRHACPSVYLNKYASANSSDVR